MSYPSNLSEYGSELYSWAMKCPLPKGLVITQYGQKERYKLLQSSVAHGCPLVEEIETIDAMQHHRTLYQHLEIVQVILDKMPELKKFVFKDES